MFTSNKELVEELISLGYLKNPLLIEAFLTIDRKNFVLPEYQKDAYLNQPLPIGFGQTISQPLTVAFMLELLDLKEKEKVLEIGAGSGWQTALIAFMVNRSKEKDTKDDSNEESTEIKGKVVALERIPELVKFAIDNVSKYNFIEKGIVEIVEANGYWGWEKEAPYDKIIAAAASDEIPQKWKEQLKIGGKIVAPIKNSIVVLEKINKKDFEEKEFFGFSFVPLIGD
ncbi:MAG: protein-L-isoaspartate O-methyltransferase [Candidatus Parcubacteria bacterium]|nr:protein-L-isoaspartate O-methyltransferase [Patescibacteria group bacterium]BCX16225.1 MAG: protein-L-isoaspartate O-methyltransferase [Candidatus Parcubacteria bacterium]